MTERTRIKVSLLRQTGGSGQRFDVIGSFYTNIVGGVIYLAEHGFCIGQNTCDVAFNIDLFTDEEVKQMLNPKMRFR